MSDSGESNRQRLLDLLEKEDTGRNHVVFDIGGESVDRYTLFVRDGYTIDSYALSSEAERPEEVRQQIDTLTIGDIRSSILDFGVFGKPADSSNLLEGAQKGIEHILDKYAEMKREKDAIVSGHDRIFRNFSESLDETDDNSASPSM